LRNIPIDQLRTFVTIVDLGSYTQAADVLGRTQPAVSLQIKRLQELIGHNVFSRASHSIELTPQGETLHQYAVQILALNDKALSDLNTASVGGLVRLGIPSEFATTLLPKVVGRFARAYPNVNLEVTSALSKDLLSKQNKTQFDIVLALHLNPKDAGAALVKSETLVWAGSKDYELSTEAAIRLVAAPEGCVYRRRALERLKENNLEWRLIYTDPDLTGITAAIKTGLGITPLAASAVPEDLAVIHNDARLPKLGQVGLSVSKLGRSPNEAADLLADFIKTSLL
jgi:DNA-binding transcriptional LysR family regulator